MSAGAGRARVRAGMAVAEARAACAALEVLPWEDAAVDAAILRATAAFLVASPQVTPVAGAPGLWWVGASGFDRVGGERGLVRALLRVARRWHPGARVAIADSCVAARAAVWQGTPGLGRRHLGLGDGRDDVAPDGRAAGIEDAVIVPPGACAAYLARVPLALLPMDDELRATLGALGLRTAGAFAALAAADVEQRWGAEGLAAWRLAHGDDPRRPVLARAEAAREVRVELATPSATMEPVFFLVRSALDRLCTTLAADARAAAAVAITLTLDDGRGALPSGGVPHTITREVRPARPVARVVPLFERCRALLDRWTLDAPVIGVAVAVVATAPATGEQGNLLDQTWRDPAATDAALARLRAELGPDVVVRPVARDAHRPEAAGGWLAVDDDAAPADASVPALPDESPPPGAPAAGPVPDERAGPAPDALPAALRLLERPEPADAECDGDTPRALQWRGRRLALARAAGPERLSGDWWTTASYRRDYWRCESADDGRELLVFLDHSAGAQWYVHGWYD